MFRWKRFIFSVVLESVYNYLHLLSSLINVISFSPCFSSCLVFIHRSISTLLAPCFAGKGYLFSLPFPPFLSRCDRLQMLFLFIFPLETVILLHFPRASPFQNGAYFALYSRFRVDFSRLRIGRFSCIFLSPTPLVIKSVPHFPLDRVQK